MKLFSPQVVSKMNGHLPCLRMLSYRTCVYTTRYPPPHTNNRYALLVSLYIIQIFYYIQYRKKNLTDITEKSPRVDLSSGSATQELRECHHELASYSPSLDSACFLLAPFSGRLFHPGVDLAAHSTRLISYLLSKRGILSFQHVQQKS